MTPLCGMASTMWTSIKGASALTPSELLMSDSDRQKGPWGFCCITESLPPHVIMQAASVLLHANCIGEAQESQLSHIEFFKRWSFEELQRVAMLYFFKCLETCGRFKIAPFETQLSGTEWYSSFKKPKEVPASSFLHCMTNESMLSSAAIAEQFHTFTWKLWLHLWSIVLTRNAISVTFPISHFLRWKAKLPLLLERCSYNRLYHRTINQKDTWVTVLWSGGVRQSSPGLLLFHVQQQYVFTARMTLYTERTWSKSWQHTGSFGERRQINPSKKVLLIFRASILKRKTKWWV